MVEPKGCFLLLSNILFLLYIPRFFFLILCSFILPHETRFPSSCDYLLRVVWTNLALVMAIRAFLSGISFVDFYTGHDGPI